MVYDIAKTREVIVSNYILAASMIEDWSPLMIWFNE